MTGNVSITNKKYSSSLFPHIVSYFVIDGGSGAHIRTILTQCRIYDNTYLHEVVSPRHATLLLIIEPLGHKLIPAIQQIVQSLAQPAFMLRITLAPPDSDYPLSDVFPNTHPIPFSTQEYLLKRICDISYWIPLTNPPLVNQEPTTIQLPQKHEQELATELAVISLGPIQPFTAGPLRLFLICDGEQVQSVQLETGYAYRGLDQRMLQSSWQQGLLIARQVDPLAPLSGQLAYVRAIESLQKRSASSLVEQHRDGVIACERALNYLWWAGSFMAILSVTRFHDRIIRLATHLRTRVDSIWQQSPETWIVPQGTPRDTHDKNKIIPKIKQLQQIMHDLLRLRTAIEQDRLFALRTRDIGIISHKRIQQAAIRAPALLESQPRSNDVLNRTLNRFTFAAHDITQAVHALEQGYVEQEQEKSADWHVPAGEAFTTVEGPRGTIGLYLKSQGDIHPHHLAWQRPSEKLLAFVPELLQGQKLADAEVILASLDLAMMEAEG